MNVYRLKAPLWLAASAFAVAAVGVVLHAALWPVEPPARQSVTVPASPADPDAGAEQDRPLDYYAAIWQRDLRAALYEEPKVVPPPPPPPTPKLHLKLTATMVEPGFTYASFTDGAGRTHLKRVGEVIEGAQVKSISDGSVTLILAGIEVTLKVEKKVAP
jgi:hypothetical protein